MKRLQFISLLLVIGLFIQSCQNQPKPTENDREAVSTVLNQWHKDVAQYNYKAYFDAMSDDAVFIGTDATEVWSKTAFMAFSKPFFDKQQTWDFKPLERHIHFCRTGDLVWFDETLDTWMGVSRGSGVVVKENDRWLIKQYVLSMTIPNDVATEVVKVKKSQDSLFLANNSY